VAHGLTHFFAFVLRDLRTTFFSQVSHEQIFLDKSVVQKTMSFNVTQKMKMASPFLMKI